MSLSDRITGLNQLGSRFVHKRLDTMLLEHEIDRGLFESLQLAADVYIRKCVGKGSNSYAYGDHIESIDLLDDHYDGTPCITPNGMIVPKNNTILEYNMLVAAFVDVIESCAISDLIDSWHVPLNLRVKRGFADVVNLGRHHPTEDPHSDSWAGESSESVTTHIPICGDTWNNHLTFFSPPADFDESWLGPLPTYKDGSHIAGRYKKLDIVPQQGHLYFHDFGGLHASDRKLGAATRVSIDTTFVLRRPTKILGKEHPWRENERALHEDLRSIGRTKVFYFPDNPFDKVDSSGGFKHPSTCFLKPMV